jgi:flagellar biosynthesis protein FlhF
MSTLSFQDYVRQRRLKRREAQLAAEAPQEAAAAPLVASPAALPAASPIATVRSRLISQREAAKDVPVLHEELQHRTQEGPGTAARAGESLLALAPMAVATAAAAAHQDSAEMMGELRSMRGLIEQRFGALAFMEKLQRQPRQAQLSQRLLDAGFSPALIRKLAESLPAEVDEMTWAAGVLERNLSTGEREQALEDAGGVYALVGTTGVGKTTSTAKLAAAFAARHGAAELGLITLDAYRVGAHEQLRTYGRILGVPVHTAHDRASLEDLLDLLSAKRMVLIDTAGMAQRDSRTRELLDMISHRSINRLLVVNASAQGETIEDQLAAYGAPACRGMVLSKLDEAVKLGPALDSMIRHRLKVLAVANGQRVPEDWHRLSAHALVQRALKCAPAAAWRLDVQDVNLIFAGLPAAQAAARA